MVPCCDGTRITGVHHCWNRELPVGLCAWRSIIMSFLIRVRFCLNGLLFKTKISDHVEQLLLASPSVTLSSLLCFFLHANQCKESPVVAASPFTQYNLGFFMKGKKLGSGPTHFIYFWFRLYVWENGEIWLYDLNTFIFNQIISLVFLKFNNKV